jgi:hypothetical protein
MARGRRVGVQDGLVLVAGRRADDDPPGRRQRHKRCNDCIPMQTWMSAFGVLRDELTFFT